MVEGRAQVARPCWPFPFADGAAEPPTPPYSHHTLQLGRAGGGLVRVPGVALVPGNGGMWTKEHSSLKLPICF